MTDFRQWLEQQGLGKYAGLLAENEVDLEVLPELEESDLEKLGLALGPRKKLLKAIRDLGASEMATAPARSAPLRAPSQDAERRQLTVMFADLVGSTELSQQLDPEDLRDINRAYQAAVTAAIEKYAGYVARYMGDGVLAYFGYPQAHEDDAERALRAGLELIDAVSRLEVGMDLSVRVGVASGPVVVGDIVGEGAAQESAVVGETPNLAARLQATADPNTLIVSAATEHLVAGRFDLEPLAQQTLKGIARPVSAYRVRAVREVSRFEATRESRFTPLVGRDEELEILLRRWTLAVDGEGQAVLLSGEAGVGKSRIVQALQDALAGSGCSRILYFCLPYHQSSAFHPVIEQLERVNRIESGQSAGEKLNALNEAAGKLQLNADETVPFFAELLSIPYEGSYAALDLTPEQLRRRILDVLVNSVEAMASQEPVLFVVEDVHWIDPSTQDFLGHLIERIRNTRALVVVTHRPEYEPPWRDYPNVTAIALNNLGRRDSAAMIAAVSGGGRLPESTIEEIIDRTDGVPLFIEEITAALSETAMGSGTVSTQPRGVAPGTGNIPSTLQDLLMERLDRLAHVKETAQLAAVIGRSFSLELLKAVSAQDAETLEQALMRLVESGLVYGRRGVESTYDFKHALVRDAAYQSLLKRDRQACHRRIAAAMSAAALENPPLELIAHHFEEGGVADEAAQRWRKAGERALGQFAHVEAISDFNRALLALKSVPSGDEWLRFELETHTLLGPALMYVKGQGAPEVEQTYVRALAIGEELGDSKASFISAWGLWRMQFARADMRTGHEFARKCKTVSADSTDPVAKLGTAFALGANSLFSGDCSAAVQYFEDSIAIYRGLEDKSGLAVFGQDPGLSSLCYLAWARWVSGYPDLSVAPCEEAIRLARDIGKPALLAIATGFAGMTYLLYRNIPKMLEYAQECHAICNQHEFRQHAAMSNIMLACAHSHDGDHPRAVELAEECINEKVALRSNIALPWFSYYLAETYLAAGRLREALDAARRGIEFAARGGERFFEPENHRIRACILDREPGADPKEVQSLFDDALQLARSQKARSLELRAAVSLARSTHGRSNRDRTRTILSSIYESFTEGIDTPDLDEARCLLDELD